MLYTSRSRMPRVVIAAFVVLGSACTMSRSFTAADEGAVRAVLATQQAAWNRGDLDEYMAGYLRSPDLVFTSGSKVRRGWQETHDKYRARYGTDKATMGKLAFEILSVQALGADGAIVLGRWVLTDTPNAGAGIFSVALRRTASGWVVVHDHTSSDPAEPAAQPTDTSPPPAS